MSMELGDKITEKVQETIHDKIQDNVRELPDQTRRILDEASDQIAKYYEVSSEFVRDNQILVLVGAGIALGLTGFFLGRASKSVL